MKKQYKVEVVKEGVLGTLFLGSSKLPIKKIEEVTVSADLFDVGLLFFRKDLTKGHYVL